ncbi:unnamed protein product [Didymodactylos carnosus]|uniref:Helix-turn-helix domain-containing protein n=1 Tax=Didymodactylos carnosus TaxID=1234261 RepID=A0A815QPP4_9BILA|nr:unnamed protein product [Didymodactylos carnosus]CAF4335186.1 unnamed protein product [Didymodactylos carnosus]
MARLVLDTNCFAYKDKYYQQIHGGGMSSAFTQVLASIYMLEWEEHLIQHQAKHGEIYGRNEHGHLRTCVYHKPTADPYYLPYTSDHSHKYHRNIPYNALIRAARLCSNVHDFNLERTRIDVSLLLGQYPPKIISKQFLRFFQVNNAMSVLAELNADTYQRLHQKLINQIALNEKQLNDKAKNPVKYPPVLEKKTWDRTVINLRYIYESGPIASFSHKFYSWWKKHYRYPESAVKNKTVRLKSKINRKLTNYLIRKKPPRHRLTLKKQKDKQ